jgi:dihydropteroate synthase
MPILMGILNVTPDSFSDGSPQATVSDHVKKALSLLKEGADIIDIGGESTRPGASLIEVKEEMQRVLPVVRELQKLRPDVALSVDTQKLTVAEAAVDEGIQIINDVSFASDLSLIKLAARSNVKYVLMHSRGTPQKMMQLTDYGSDIVAKIAREIDEKINLVLNAGVIPENLILDLGFGFAKTPEQCVHLLQNLAYWRKYPYPFLLGISRKRFLQSYTGENLSCERDEISAHLAYEALSQGVAIIRTHNVALTRQVLRRDMERHL